MQENWKIQFSSQYTKPFRPDAGLKANKLPVMVAPTEETDNRICKAGIKAVNVVIAESTHRKQ